MPNDNQESSGDLFGIKIFPMMPDGTKVIHGETDEYGSEEEGSEESIETYYNRLESDKS